jgi:hypothetical protein
LLIVVVGICWRVMIGVSIIRVMVTFIAVLAAFVRDVAGLFVVSGRASSGPGWHACAEQMCQYHHWHKQGADESVFC